MGRRGEWDYDGSTMEPRWQALGSDHAACLLLISYKANISTVGLAAPS